jgi:hypothetical protein
MAGKSWVGGIGVAGAQAARISMPVNARMGNFVFMLPLFLLVDSFII